MASGNSTKPLGNMSIEEVEELIHKQEGLLKNKALLNKLPDKGQKLQFTLDTAHKVLTYKRQFTPIKVDSRRINDVLAAVEWRTMPKLETRHEEDNEEEEEEEQVGEDQEKILKMLAAVACPPAARKKTKEIPSSSLESDLEGLEAAFLKAVRIDDAVRAAPARRPKFVPNALPIEKQKPVHYAGRKVEMISLADSVAAHKEAELRARKDGLRFAASRLKIVSLGGVEKQEEREMRTEGVAFSEYRESRDDDSEDEEAREEGLIRSDDED